MTILVNNYLKRFGELVTASQERYKADILFRSIVNITGLLTLLTLLCVGLFFLVLNYSNQAIVEAIVHNIQTVVLSGSGVPPEIDSSVRQVQIVSILYIILGIGGAAALIGYLFFRFMLLPTRNTLHYQKLFISNVAHELRTPLSIIKTSTEVALLDDRLLASTKTTLNEIISELDRVSEIINNLLSLNTLTRPERMKFGNVDLNSLIATVTDRHLALAHERKVLIKTKKDPYSTVWGNAAALEQVVTNLIKNAIIYTQKNGNGHVEITVSPNYQGSIVFTVSDNGIGIAQKDLAHVFEPFYRADMSRVRSVKSSGSGLGLAIVNEIVRAHHGKIHIESARNQGTTVSVFLPVGVTKEMTSDIETNGKSHVSLDFTSKA